MIREPDIADAFGIANVHVTSWRETHADLVPASLLARMSSEHAALDWAERILASLAARDDIVRIATDDPTGSVVGVVHARFTDGRSGRKPIVADDGTVVCGAEIAALYVLSSHQRRGIGRALFAAAHAHVAAHERLPLGLWVVAANSAVRFYERLGGVAIGERTSMLDGAPIFERAYAFR